MTATFPRQNDVPDLDRRIGFRHRKPTLSRIGKQRAGDVSESQAGTEPGHRSDDLLGLAALAAAGDPDASATLILHVGGPMLRVIRKVIGRQHADVDDVAQDAVIAFLRALNTFRGECSVLHFANRVALLTALAARRSLRVRLRWAAPNGDGAAVEEIADEEAPSPLANTMAGRRRQMVRDLLDDLPEVIAESLALHFILGYTVDEIAATLVTSPNTVWSRLRLGKQALRRKLKKSQDLADLIEVMT